MDPISGTASFIAIAGALQGIYKRLARYAKRFINAFSEIASLTNEVSGFSRTLLYIAETLESLPVTVLASIRKYDLEKHHLGRAQGIEKDLKELLSHLKPLKEYEKAGHLRRWFHGAAVRSKWLTTKSKAEVLRVSLMSSTQSLNLLMAIANCQSSREQLFERKKRSADADKVDLLEMKIKVLDEQVQSEISGTSTIRKEYAWVLEQQNIATASISEILQAVDLTVGMARSMINDTALIQEATAFTNAIHQTSHTTSRW